MSLFLIRDRLQQVFASELTLRLPQRKFVPGRRDTSDTGPMGVVKVDHVMELAPNTGVYEAEVVIVVLRNIDAVPPEGSSNAAEQSKFSAEVEHALNTIPKPSYDDELEIALHGWVIEQVAEAQDQQDHADMLFLKVGCGLLERNAAIPTPQAEVPA
jgi:hypothetical protein